MTNLQKERLRMKAEIFKAMGHPNSIGGNEFLQDGEKCVCEIVDHVGTEISNVSKHLSGPEKIRNSFRTEEMALRSCTALPCPALSISANVLRVSSYQAIGRPETVMVA